MNKLFNGIILMICFFITACNDDNHPKEIAPITFEKSEYSVMLGKGAAIPFSGGGGEFELTASDPEVLGRLGIDIESPNHILYIQPAKTGESYLTIKDVKAQVTVTLHFIIEDFYLSFSIREIDGTNVNDFFEIGREIRFIRDQENSRNVKVMKYQNMTFLPTIVGEGHFNINRNDNDIWTMDLSLHHSMTEDSATYDYEYTMGGDVEFIFESVFDIDREKSTASASSKSQPVKSVQMNLTDKNNGCKITCQLEY